MQPLRVGLKAEDSLDPMSGSDDHTSLRDAITETWQQRPLASLRRMQP